MDPLDNFETILSGNNSDTGNTSDEVFKRNTALQSLIAQLQRAEFCSIAVWKTNEIRILRK